MFSMVVLSSRRITSGNGSWAARSWSRVSSSLRSGSIMAFQLQLCAVVRKSDIDATLASPTAQGKRLLEPLKAMAAELKLPLNILEDKEVSNEAEVHRHEGELC